MAWEIEIHVSAGQEPDKYHRGINQAMTEVEQYFQSSDAQLEWDDELQYKTGEGIVFACIKQLPQDILLIDEERIPDTPKRIGRFALFTDGELWLFYQMLSTTTAQSNIATSGLTKEIIYEQWVRQDAAKEVLKDYEGGD